MKGVYDSMKNVSGSGEYLFTDIDKYIFSMHGL